MIKLSLCMIVKDEEKTLASCLDSIKKLVDEIIIVDTGSSDKTKEIAKKYTNLVFDFNWCDDFSMARNFAKSKATCDYIIWLDADDVMPKTTANYLLKIKPYLNADVYMLKYDVAFSNGKPTFSYFRERILKNCQNTIWQGAVHECVAPFGEIIYLNKSILHIKKEFSKKHTNRNVNIYKKIENQRPLQPREMYYYGRELYDHKKYKKCIKILSNFLKSNKGWVENIIDAHFIIAKCYINLNLESNATSFLFDTFKYDCPRANVCCIIGDIFFRQKKFEMAKHWYVQATKCKDISYTGAFVEKKYYNYYPYLQLSCCYFYLKDIKKAFYYNEKAGKHFESEIIINNRNFYNNSLKN